MGLFSFFKKPPSAGKVVTGPYADSLSILFTKLFYQETMDRQNQGNKVFKKHIFIKMKFLITLTTILFLFQSCGPAKQSSSSDGKALILPELQGAEKWFTAWEFVSREIYNIHTAKPVDFIFFDTTYVYSTSLISIPDGESIDGPVFFNEKLTWKKKPHNGRIKLPNEQVVPVGLMSFASPGANDQANAFFVMPLPDFWKKAGVESKELGLENLVTGVFLHEFSHSQQMQNFGKKISEYENRAKYKVDFSDDIVQDYFEKDSVYNAKFRNEVAVFYDAAVANDKSMQIDLIIKGIKMLKLRQDEYFTDSLNLFREIDDFFLTMEGLGQYTMYAWLVHPRGGNIAAETALKGVRRGGRSWSQEEGLSLLLLLDKLYRSSQWAAQMFGNETISVVELIRRKLSER
ncbi:MAG: hypothetical protein ABI675_28455 [Chitinophagaceae bacterium]